MIPRGNMTKQKLGRRIRNRLLSKFGLNIPIYIDENGSMYYYYWHSTGQVESKLKFFSWDRLQDLKAYCGLTPEEEMVVICSNEIALSLPFDCSKKLDFIAFRLLFGR
jgi:hypothetical protein